MTNQISYKWVRLIPTAPMGPKWHEQAKEAREISRKFIMDNDIHYRLSQNIFEMRLQQLDRTFLEIFIPSYIKVDILETKVYGKSRCKT